MWRAGALPSLAIVAIASGGGAGCFVILDHDLGLDEGELVARPDDFAGFTSWPSVVVGENPAEAPHEATERRAYLNFAPPEGAVAFPVGTIIVKTGAGGEATGESGDEVHAMVKRGNGFNADGARGWEWFEIAIPDGDDDPVLIWRGENPPAGESYGCPPGETCDEALTCNSCHAGAAGNDYVNSPAFDLGNIDESLLR